MGFPTRLPLPERLVKPLREFAASGVEPVTPRDAATVVLLRDADADGGRGRAAGADPDVGPDLEAYLLRRVGTMKFAPGAYVFPGGAVDRRDLDHTVAWAGPAPDEWASRLGVDVPFARALLCAAVRETFEESGVLLAGPTEDAVVEDATGDGWEADRHALLDRSWSLAEFLERRRLVLRSDLLRAWAHWITPVFEPRRYSTYFFVAALPEGQRTRAVGGEADRVAWVQPGAALEAYRRGEMSLMVPTAATLADLTDLATVDAVLRSSAGRDLDARVPAVVDTDEGAFLVLPGDPRYPG